MKHPLLKYSGGKFKLRHWVIANLPQHVRYVELFGGGGSVLLSKPPSKIEIYNDIDGSIVNLFEVLACPFLAKEFHRRLRLVPYSRVFFERKLPDNAGKVSRALDLFVSGNMCFGGTSSLRKKSFVYQAWMNGNSCPSQFQRKVDSLHSIVERLKNVVIESRHFLKLIETCDSPETLFYADPPYLMDNSKTYKHTMTLQDHEALLDNLLNVKGKVVISGYDSELYNSKLSAFRKVVKVSHNEQRRQTLECLWISPDRAHRSQESELALDLLPVAKGC